MSDHQEDARRNAQLRALDIDRRSGALISHEYLERRQEVIAVNKSDLEDVLTFDGLESGLAGTGLFFLSGALWLGVEKFAETGFDLTPILVFCFMCVVIGVILVGLGIFMRGKKRAKIERIFQETKPRR